MSHLRSLSLTALLAGLLAATTVTADAQSQSASALTVQIGPLRDAQGVVRVALYDRDRTWLSNDAQQSCVTTAQAGETQCTFEALAPGRYAIAVLHDADADGQMDYDWIGIPSEGYAFSNDAPVVFSAPGFGSAAFEHGRASQTIHVHARYGL